MRVPPVANGAHGVDRAFVLQIVKENGLALQHANAVLREDKAVVLAALRDSAETNADTLKYALGDLRKDEDVVLAAVKAHGAHMQIAVYDSLNQPFRPNY